jgi:hypothetical protein
MNRVLTLVVLATVVSGCATTETQTFKDDPLIRPGAQIELGAVTVPPASDYEINVAGLMRAALETSLDEHDIAWQGDAAADRFLLDVVVDDYEPGNAFKRWLMPGFGSTIVHVSGKLTDVSTGDVAGELDHERAVHAGGAYTIGAWETRFKGIADDITTQLQNRIENKGFTVRLTPWPARDVEIPVAETRQTFNFLPPTDAREERARIGERTAAFEVSMGSVFFDRQVPAFLAEAIAADLLGAGHTINVGGPGRPVSIEVTRFWTHTNTTALYWDVIGNIEVGVSVGSESDEADVRTASFTCEQTKRTYAWPSLDLVTGVMDACLVELLASVRDDAIWNAPGGD